MSGIVGSWTDELVSRLRDLVARGFTDREISDELRCKSQGAVRQKRIALGLIGRVVQRWTAEEDAILREMWKTDRVMPLIAERLGRSVAGIERRVSRLRLPPRKGAVRSWGAGTAGTRTRMERLEARGDRLPPPLPTPPKNPGGCQYIHGDPKREGWHYCGRMKRLNSSWCEEHHRLVFVPYQLAPREAPTVFEIMQTRKVAA